MPKVRHIPDLSDHEKLLRGIHRSQRVLEARFDRLETVRNDSAPSNPSLTTVLKRLDKLEQLLTRLAPHAKD